MKLTIKYDSMTGYVFPDGRSKIWVDETIAMFKRAVDKGEDPEWEIIVGGELLVDMFRLEIANGNLDHSKIKFRFKNETIDVNKFGTLRHWPKGFCDTSEKISIDLLTVGNKAWKAMKKKD